MSDETDERGELRAALRELRDGAGEAGLEKVFKELGVRSVHDIRGHDVEKAIALAKAALDAAAKSARTKDRASCTQARLNDLADDVYAKRRGVKAE